MNRNIIIDSKFGYRRLVVLEDDNLVEAYVENARTQNIVGNIYVGRVQNIVKSTNSAFIDIGLEENAYIHFNDIAESKTRENTIKDFLHVGQEIVVQVLKEAQGTKPPKLTTNIMLYGKYLILTPNKKYIGVSSKIHDKNIKANLIQVISDKIKNRYGAIIRTAAEKVDFNHLKLEVDSLIQKWEDINEKGKYIKAPMLLHREDFIEKLISDLYFPEDSSIIINNEDEFNMVKDKLSITNPSTTENIKLYEMERSIFSMYSVQKKFDKLFMRKVWLKCGGYIVIDKTEAMTVIDVNSGKFISRNNTEDMILKVNLEAAEEIARQIRLRDIGGIIIIDFIDMKSEQNRDKLVQGIRGFLLHDRGKSCVLGITRLGIIEITRRKIGNSIYEKLYRKCYRCNGSGEVINYDMICLKILNEIQDYHAIMQKKDIVVEISTDLYSYFKNNFNNQLVSIGKERECTVAVQSSDQLEYQDFKIICE